MAWERFIALSNMVWVDRNLLFMNRSLISIVVPCFNEAEVIAEAVKRLDRFCDEAIDLQVEIIFVDDGSRDETRHLIEGFAKTNSRINLIFTYLKLYADAIGSILGIRNPLVSSDAVRDPLNIVFCEFLIVKYPLLLK